MAEGDTMKKEQSPFPILAAILVLVHVLCGCQGGKGGKPMTFAAPVTTAQVTQRTVPVDVRLIGNVQTINTVSIKSQVQGILSKVHFKEGEFVKKGDPLFTINRDPFEAAVRQAQGTLDKDRASVVQAKADLQRTSALVKVARANVMRDSASVKQAGDVLERDKSQSVYADAELKRYRDLLEKGFATQEQYEQLRANSESLHSTVNADISAIENARATLRSTKASLENAIAAVRSQEATLQNAIETVKASQASLDSANIQLDFCEIKAPITGRTGSLIVQEGNLVKAVADTAMVVINQISPIYVIFPAPEQYLQEIRDRFSSGALTIEALPAPSEKHPEAGVVTFIDNTVDPTTGTFLVKATFPNRNMHLWPGEFVDVILRLSTLKDALLVPSEAVETGQKGEYLFVVKPDKTVEYRTVVTGITHDGDIVIENGVRAGETVVTDGQVRLVNGTKVDIREPAEKRPPGGSGQ